MNDYFFADFIRRITRKINTKPFGLYSVCEWFAGVGLFPRKLFAFERSQAGIKSRKSLDWSCIWPVIWELHALERWLILMMSPALPNLDVTRTVLNVPMSSILGRVGSFRWSHLPVSGEMFPILIMEKIISATFCFSLHEFNLHQTYR